MQNEDVKQLIVNYIRENGSITYSEIENIMTAAKFQWEGDLGFCSTQNESIVFWLGWNSQAYSLITELIKSGAVKRVPCHVLNYLISGKCLTLPLAKRNKKYKTEHWLPCLFVLGGRKTSGEKR